MSAHAVTLGSYAVSLQDQLAQCDVHPLNVDRINTGCDRLCDAAAHGDAAAFARLAVLIADIAQLPRPIPDHGGTAQ